MDCSSRLARLSVRQPHQEEQHQGALSAFTRPGLRILSHRDSRGRRFTAWCQPGYSWYFSDRRSLLRWIRWPPHTQTGGELRAWLDELEARDAKA